MQFDISLFGTIASASASFVAILGGFIASKLLTVNSEREALNNRLKEIDNEINLKGCEVERLQKGLDEDDALDFIKDHIIDLINQEKLSDIYKDDEQNILPIDILSVYWEKAQESAKKFDAEYRNGGARNEDDIPSALASEVKDKPFEYDVCCEIAIEMLSKLRKIGAINRWYERDQQRIYSLNQEIDFLTLQRDQLLQQKDALKKPRGMVGGLIIFALFSLFNIVQPLIFSVIPIECSAQYNMLRIVSIVLIGIGLFCTLVYLSWLLKWKEKEED